MKLSRLAWRQLLAKPLQSGLVFASTLMIAGLVLSTFIILHGAQTSLRLVQTRLGADIIVFPLNQKNHI